MTNRELALGRVTDCPDSYAPEVLDAIPRARHREQLGITAELPFAGADVWNAWELTWLGDGRRPAAATARIVVPVNSPNIIESKSLKLYLNSFAMTEFASAKDVEQSIGDDLSRCVGSPVDVRLAAVSSTEARTVARLAGRCLDDLDVDCADWEVNAGLLRADSDNIVTADLHTHLLRSLCPVTAQPDTGSLQISYRGPTIDAAGLLRYIVSYRQHSDFHESCIERMFIDIRERCQPLDLTLHARYQRRGGIDINPYRSTSAQKPRDLRLWRQ
ncbi:MAG: NADPH-dependent 7-cyano-7-deazaguanine reductase QueF [Woeseiaceae bacterium]